MFAGPVGRIPEDGLVDAGAGAGASTPTTPRAALPAGGSAGAGFDGVGLLSVVLGDGVAEGDASGAGLVAEGTGSGSSTGDSSTGSSEGTGSAGDGAGGVDGSPGGGGGGGGSDGAVG
ncbi:hypothetical protein [Arthrobacter burdickii]|uniref:BatC protein n=1 Tax=Arthrobacter burdickii TaxID=3035920 RepID=A0ABT8JYL9_9MICC|nr:hypothetical protein [Arthrobacter burdickii]MDN4609452.1 hypothetical protein [Arthrobacter burdickii]